MKLPEVVKKIAKDSIGKYQISSLRFIVENYKFGIAARFIKLVYRLNKSRKLVVVERFELHTEFKSFDEVTNEKNYEYVNGLYYKK